MIVNRSERARPIDFGQGRLSALPSWEQLDNGAVSPSVFFAREIMDLKDELAIRT